MRDYFGPALGTASGTGRSRCGGSTRARAACDMIRTACHPRQPSGAPSALRSDSALAARGVLPRRAIGATDTFVRLVLRPSLPTVAARFLPCPSRRSITRCLLDTSPIRARFVAGRRIQGKGVNSEAQPDDSPEPELLSGAPNRRSSANLTASLQIYPTTPFTRAPRSRPTQCRLNSSRRNR
jgi:hypothetical protein